MFSIYQYISTQIIIDPTGAEIFAKDPKLAKLLRELKLMPISYNKKKFTGFCRVSLMANLLCIGCFAAG